MPVFFKLKIKEREEKRILNLTWYELNPEKEFFLFFKNKIVKKCREIFFGSVQV